MFNADTRRLDLFMRQQLTESIRFDCSSLPAPARQDPMVWYQEQVDDAAQSIERYAADVEAERTRVQNANAWIDALYESLETPTAEAPHA